MTFTNFIIAALFGSVVVMAALLFGERDETRHWKEIVDRRDVEIAQLKEQLPFGENRKG